MANKHGAKLNALLFCLALSLCVVMTGCSSDGSSDSVAATVRGQAIAEDEVTAYIDSYRSGVQCTDDESWAEYLADNGLTARDFREATIEELAVPIIVKAKADELGITVDESAVDAQVQTLRRSLLVEDDESWQEELARYGMTEEKLRENYSNSNLREQVFNAVAADVVPTDEDLRDYITQNLLGATTKKIACVYCSDYGYVYDAMEFAQGAKSLKAGMRKLKTRANEMGVNYADVGWDLNAELTSNMRNAIDHLGKGELADAPLSDGGIYYLFYIEDAFTFPPDGSKVDLDDESLKAAVSDLASVALKGEVGSAWLQERIGEDVVINDMPSGLSYDVEPYGSNADSSASADSADESSENTDKEADHAD